MSEYPSRQTPMHTQDSVRPVNEIFEIFGSGRIDLPERPGVYAFWWVSSKDLLMQANTYIVLKGPGGSPVDVEYQDWWPDDLVYPCLYVGKSTNMKNRFSQHIKRGTTGRLHGWNPDNTKAKPATTSCQLRFGIEHVFPHENDPLNLIVSSVGFSYRTEFPDNPIAERFFEEDRLIGAFRPRFNIDSEC